VVVITLLCAYVLVHRTILQLLKPIVVAVLHHMTLSSLMLAAAIVVVVQFVVHLLPNLVVVATVGAVVVVHSASWLPPLLRYIRLDRQSVYESHIRMYNAVVGCSRHACIFLDYKTNYTN
jgi:hypothetical protein